MTTPSVNRIITFLETQKGHLPRIAREAGLGLEWLRKLVAGENYEPRARQGAKIPGFHYPKKEGTSHARSEQTVVGEESKNYS